MKKPGFHLFSVCIIAVAILGCNSLQSDNPEQLELELTRQVIIDDMALPNDGHPAGVPNTYAWYEGSYSWWQPQNAEWVKGPYPPEGFTKILPWGQVYADATMPNINIDYPEVRVHLRDMELWILRKNGKWIRLGGKEKVSGQAYVEDFTDDEWKKADVRNESDGGISVKAGSGYNFHFWPSNGEYDIEPGNIKGVLAVCKARLIGVSLNQNPKYLVSIGADYWKPNTRWDGLDENNIAVGAGRHKLVSSEWQYFTMHTFKPEELPGIVFPDIK